MPCGALVDGTGGATAGLGQGIVLSDVWRDVEAAQGGDVVSAVIGFVLADRDAPASSSGLAPEHRFCGTAFGCAVGLADLAGDRQAIAVLHDDVAHVAQPGLAAGCLAIELGVGGGGGGMGGVLGL